MPDWVAAWPFAWAFAFMFVVVFGRSQATYWAARAVAAGATRTRWGARFDRERFTTGIRAIEKWGWPVIPLSFVTIGFQTAVIAGAGLIQMRWRRFTLAAIPGCLVWALIWSTVGWAAFEASLALAARSPWALVAAFAVVTGVITTIVVVRRRGKRSAAQPVQTLPSTVAASSPVTSMDD